jgi:hypothetical protein
MPVYTTVYFNSGNKTDRIVSIHLLCLYYTTTCFDLDRSSSGGFNVDKYGDNELQVDVKMNLCQMYPFSRRNVWYNSVTQP